jgi:hypothetical protein
MVTMLKPTMLWRLSYTVNSNTYLNNSQKFVATFQKRTMVVQTWSNVTLSICCLYCHSKSPAFVAHFH